MRALVLTALMSVLLPPAVALGSPPDCHGVIADELLTGARLPGANGLTFDDQGRLYVANGSGSQITILDPDSGAILDERTAEEGVVTPDDVAVGPDGAIYWTAYFTGEVGRLAPDGTFQSIANLGPGVNPIAFSPEGRLFVARCFLGDELYELDPEGISSPRLIAANIGAGCALNGMSVGLDGRLYGPQPILGRVVAVDVDTGQLSIIAQGFSQAIFSTKFAPNGNLYAVDGPFIRQIDLGGGPSPVIAAVPFLPDNLAINDDGRIFVSSLTTAEIVEVFLDGTLRTVSSGGFVSPQGLALAPTSNGPSLLVGNGPAITRVDPINGTPLDSRFSGELVAFSLSRRNGKLFTASALTNSVAVWDDDTGDPTILGRDFEFPLDAVGFGDDVLVAEGLSGSVLRVNLEPPHTRTVFATGLTAPAGLARRAGSVWVSDIERGKIYQIALLGVALKKPVLVASGLDRPQGIAPGRLGELVVVETGAGRVVSLDILHNRRCTLTDDLRPAVPPLNGRPTGGFFFGVEVDLHGTVYASDQRENRILRIQRPN